MFTAGRKVLFDLFIPAEFVLTGYVGGELREFIAAQLFHRLLDFGEAHAMKVSLCHTNRQEVQSGSELSIDTFAVSDERRQPRNAGRRISALNGSDAAIARQRGRQTALNSIAVCGTVQS